MDFAQGHLGTPWCHQSHGQNLPRVAALSLEPSALAFGRGKGTNVKMPGRSMEEDL